MIKAGIMGGAGYTGGELLRLLLQHADVEVEGVQSNSMAGENISSVHKDLIGDTDLKFQSEVPPAEVLFLCLGHQRSREFLESKPIADGTKIIDLSQDFRIQTPDNSFVGFLNFKKI